MANKPVPPKATPSKQLPPKTKALLTGLVAQRNELQTALNGIDASINNVLATARELMDVPTDWTIGEIELGFVPPTQEASDA